MINTTRPKQKLRKIEKDKDWKIRNATYWLGRCNYYPIANNEAISLLSAAAGKLDESVYTYVTNPLNTDRPNLQGYPSKMRNIDIISPNLLMLMGELNNRLFNPIVVAVNSDLQSKKEAKEKEMVLEQVKRDFINGLVEKGLLPEEIAKTPLPQEIINKTVSTLKDEMSIMGQQALDVIIKDKKVDEIRRKTFYDFIVLSRCFSYKAVRSNDLEYDWVSPLEISFINHPTLRNVENAEAVSRKVVLPFNTVVDMFSDEPEFQDIIDELETKISVTNYQPMYAGFTTAMLRGENNQPYSTQSEGIFVEHFVFTSLCLKLKVSGVDIFGNPYTEEYDEDYIPSPTETVEEHWVNEKWHGYRIDGKHIIGVEPIDLQRGTIDNPNKCKNPYNGVIFNNNYIIPQSIVEKGIVYQIKYNIVHYHLEKTLAKNKDKMVFMPLGVIPQKEGWDEFTFLYYGDAHGFLFGDETNSQVLQAMQYIKSIDMSTLGYVKDMYGILQQIKADWDESIGVSRQRKGQAMASDGKSVNEEAVFRSSVMSEEFFKQHEDFIMSDLQGLLDLSQVAWSQGKKGTYVNSEFKNVYYDLNPEVFCYADFQIFVENSARTARQVAMLQEQLGSIAQQTNNISILPRIAQATNLSKLAEELKEIYKVGDEAVVMLVPAYI